MDPVQKVIDIARSQLGYLEKSKEAYEKNPAVLDSYSEGAGSDNYTKYARDLRVVNYFNGSKQGAAWCGTFSSWVYFTAFGRDAALALQCQPKKDNCGAGCEWIRRYYQQKGRWTSSPSPGDQVVFEDEMHVAQHTGIVVAVGEHTITTIEGNANGAVRERGYDKTNPKIAGYGHPDWSIVSEEEEKQMAKAAKIVLPFNATGTTVNIRMNPSKSAPLTDRIKVGSSVLVLDDQGEWCKVSYNGGKTGWVMSNYIEYIGMSDDDDTEPVGNDAYLAIEAQLSAIVKAVEAVRDVIGRG